MVKKNYWYINKGPGDEEDVKLGLAWLVEKCKEHKSKKAYLAVYSKQNLGGIIENVLGRDIINRLKLNKEVSLGGIPLEVITEHQNFYSLSGPVLIAFPAKKLLDKIDALSNIPAVLVIPWTLKEIDYWIQAWNAKKLGEVDIAQKEWQLSPLVIKALKALSERVNLSTGILHPSDKGATVELIERLKDAGEKIDVNEARAWLVSEGGWQPKGADDVKDIIEKIYAGRRLVIGKGHYWIDNILEIIKKGK